MSCEIRALLGTGFASFNFHGAFSVLRYFLRPTGWERPQLGVFLHIFSSEWICKCAPGVKEPVVRSGVGTIKMPILSNASGRENLKIFTDTVCAKYKEM